MIQWTVNDIPDLAGRVMLITGASSGLGRECARVLAERNATIIIASSNPERGTHAQAQIEAAAPGAIVDYMQLDLADLDAIRVFADAFKAKYDRLDVLMNNAAVTWVPAGKTKDGFERHMGINFLGHFALTGLLLNLLLSTPGTRIVTMSSRLHREAELDFDDLMSETAYKPADAYNASKLANLLFHFELHRKLTAAGTSTRAVAAHPGMAATGWADGVAGLQGMLMRAVSPLVLPKPAIMAGFQLYAAVGDDAKPGGFYGPEKETRGDLVEVVASDAARNEAQAAQLWQMAEALTGVTYPL